MGIKIRIVAILLLLVFLGAFMAVLKHTGTIQGADMHLLTDKGKEFTVSVATTDAKRARGLSGRELLRENEGMLFEFAKADFHGIWMKGMRFPLDILWLQDADTRRYADTPINADGNQRISASYPRPSAFRVVDMKENVTPETYPEIFLPKERASHVIELNGGTAGRNDIGIGSVLTVKK